MTEAKYQVLWNAPWMTWIAGIIHQIPTDAIIAGTEGGEPFYICRAPDRTGLHIGKVKPSSPGCSVASDGKELVAPLFSLLVPKWVAGNAGTLPITALPAGYDRLDLLFLCRAQVKGALQVGKMTESLASCHIGMLGSEIAIQAYEILTQR